VCIGLVVEMVKGESTKVFVNETLDQGKAVNVNVWRNQRGSADAIHLLGVATTKPN
jgi:hypothetical protein